MDNSYYKGYRRMIEWEWYKDIPVNILFNHLLRIVNYVDKKWQGRDVKKGEIITSIQNLASQTGLTPMQVRTAITKLKSTKEITSESTSTYTHIKVNKWVEYQVNVTKSVTNDQQTDNKPITTTVDSIEGNKGTVTEIEPSQKDENTEFFLKLETDPDSVIDSMNIPDTQREIAKRELFKFWNYWTEKDLRGKEKWRKESTFEVRRRLTTWLMNTKQFTSNKPYEKGNRVVG